MDNAARNHWIEKKCAKAFWGQCELPTFRRLVSDTLEWAAPGPGEHWLDLGCGGGALTRALWEKSQGAIAEVTGLDCAEENAIRYHRLAAQLTLRTENQIRFVCHNFSQGLELFEDATFDHVISGLSISYAEAWDGATESWTQAAYDRVLAEVFRVLRPGGRFVFSVNVPEPSWWKVGLRSLAGLFTCKRPLWLLKKSWRMSRYGVWLKQEARRGRFHYLPADEIEAKLREVGYQKIDQRLSYAGQAYVFRAIKSS